jgi:predicted PurR-regulated permease PerM
MKELVNREDSREQIGHSYERTLSAIFLVILAVVLAYALYPYINAFFGAFILYVAFRPIYILFINRLGIRSSLAAVLVIIITALVVLVPLYILFTIMIMEIQDLITNVGGILSIQSLLGTNSIIAIHLIRDMVPSDISIQERIIGLTSSAASLLSAMLISAVQSAGKRLIEFIIMYLVLFYMFIGEKSYFVRSLHNAVPFNEKNTMKLLSEFRSMVRTILVSSGVIAVIQGGLLTVTFLIFGLKGAFLWGFVTLILSFIPALGPPIIWVPATIIQLLQQDYISAAGVFAGGMILSSVDNLIRPAINKKVGQLHPLVSIIGVIIGLNLFGLLGIIMGPLLLSYALLMARMFNEEYL